jgi:hypothetical protein
MQDSFSGPIIINKPVVRQIGLFKDRKRTHLLKNVEQTVISFLVGRIPSFITPNILTIIGLSGSFLVLAGFIMSSYFTPLFLLLGIAGLFINWFGDSLDGRVAYFRNIPRKWYGFSLDIIMDWVSTILMGLGYFVYAEGRFEFLAFGFVVLYGWAMIIAQLRYKITDKYTIDSGIVGPTELRVIISLMFMMEIFMPGSINYFVVLVCSIIFIINILDTRKLLALGDLRDEKEKIKSVQVNEL